VADLQGGRPLSSLVGSVWVVQTKILSYVYRRLAQSEAAIHFPVEHSRHGQQKSSLDYDEIVFSRPGLELALSLVPEAGAQIFEMARVATSLKARTDVLSAVRIME